MVTCRTMCFQGRFLITLTFCWSAYLAGAIHEICDDPVCEYTWEIRRLSTMTYYDGTVTYDVTLNGTQLIAAENYRQKKEDYPFIGTVLKPDDVITADGYKRDVIAINGGFPGPNLHVMAGAQVVVHVWNKLHLEVTTIHWHGIHQQDNPWMDGVPYVTQCPILPGEKFTYIFIASPHGTRWYHAHMGAQMADGLYGILVIHPYVPMTPEFILTVSDWLHADAISYELQNPNSLERPGTGEYLEREHMSMIRFFGALINGRGRNNGEMYPLAAFKVSQGEKYRFRVAAVGLEYSCEVSIDHHQLEMVALDGADIKPILVDSFVIHPGETLDFEVTADQDSDRYWIRAVALKASLGMDPGLDDPDLGVKAVFAYEGADPNVAHEGAATGMDPVTTARSCTAESRCKIFNCPFAMHPVEHNRTCIGIDQAVTKVAYQELVEEFGLDDQDEDIEEYFFNFAFTVGSSVNGHRFVPSRAPLYRADMDQYVTECLEDQCDTKGCKCTYSVDIPLNKTIQMVLTNLSPSPITGEHHHHHAHHHAMHLHGHSMAVVKVAFPDYNQTTGRMIQQNQDLGCYGGSAEVCSRVMWSGNNRPQLNVENSVIKNTILVPAGGYVVVRFHTENPGFWFFHCHMTQHFIDGMALVLNEGPGRHPPQPDDFPSCHDFTWSQQKFSDYVTMTHDMRVGGGNGTFANVQQEQKTEGSNQTYTSNIIEVSISVCVGASIGFILLGATLPILAMTIYKYFATKIIMDKKGYYEGIEENDPILPSSENDTMIFSSSE